MNEEKRLLIYSHDSFGLGHLRRCRAIAHHLVDEFKKLSVLILSGSPIIGSFDFKARVDFVRVPGVIKLRNGEYTSLNLHIDTNQTLAIRSSIIKHTAKTFDPHLFLVDKEPLGLKGEVKETLKILKASGTHCVLGLRDVMDDPALLEQEWERKNVLPAIKDLYDEIWVYGLPSIFDPISEIEGMDDLKSKIAFTGYIRRSLPTYGSDATGHDVPSDPYILVMTGGGGDGAALIDWVLRAYESDHNLKQRLLIVFGPFMQLEDRASFQERVNRLEHVDALTFEAQMEPFIKNASAVISMGGYNTFCEILSFNKKALIVPRKVPRREQSLRADRASRLGLVRVLDIDEWDNTQMMINAINNISEWPEPDLNRNNEMLQGLNRIVKLAKPIFNAQTL